MSLQEFTDAYIECALWSSHDDEGDPLDSNYGPEDIAQTSLVAIRQDCEAFYNAHEPTWRGAYQFVGYWGEDAQAGHDFWLTRNHHGAGFWDRGLGEIGDTLTKFAEECGECYLYVGDDGAIHVD
jgi:hypothetical protein